MMPNSDPDDRLFDPTLDHIMTIFIDHYLPLTTNVNRMLHIPEVTSFHMVKCSKSYSKSCSFQKSK